MDSIAYILPWISVLLAIALACAVGFLSLKSPAGIIVAALLSILLFAAAGFDNVISMDYESQIETSKQDYANLERWKYEHLDELSLLIARQNYPSDEAVADVKLLESNGWTRRTPDMQRLLKASQALSELRVNRPDSGRPRFLYKGIPTNVDVDLVAVSLRTLGFKVIAPTENEDKLTNGNILYFGKLIDLETIKLTALTLMSAGLNITTIKPFNRTTRGNQRAVKLEWNSALSKRLPYTPDQVVEAENFK